MTKNQYLQRELEKRESKRIGKNWAKSYGILQKINAELAPELKARDAILDKLNK